ncbi:MAG: hypothetical protein A2066_12915 [Bacteroidetes bacterium GWB2_41_8]|nr:MAG: hypothetical protein A2066_12915 [Bacteroidetes bacterium GWB2_41_8]
MLKKPRFSPRPQVTISLEPILEAYCRFRFNTPPDQKEITINLKSDIGKLIHSHVHSSHFAVKGPFIINPVTVILPINQQNQYGVLSGFLYVDNWGLQKIENAVEYDFRKWVERRYEIGYGKRYDRKDIIEAVLRGLNVRNNCANFDAIKKIDYRNHRKTEEIRFAELLLSDT